MNIDVLYLVFIIFSCLGVGVSAFNFIPGPFLFLEITDQLSGILCLLHMLSLLTIFFKVVFCKGCFVWHIAWVDSNRNLFLLLFVGANLIATSGYLLRLQPAPQIQTSIYQTVISQAENYQIRLIGDKKDPLGLGPKFENSSQIPCPQELPQGVLLTAERVGVVICTASQEAKIIRDFGAGLPAAQVFIYKPESFSPELALAPSKPFAVAVVSLAGQYSFEAAKLNKRVLRRVAARLRHTPGRAMLFVSGRIGLLSHQRQRIFRHMRLKFQVISRDENNWHWLQNVFGFRSYLSVFQALR